MIYNYYELQVKMIHVSSCLIKTKSYSLPYLSASSIRRVPNPWCWNFVGSLYGQTRKILMEGGGQFMKQRQKSTQLAQLKRAPFSLFCFTHIHTYLGLLMSQKKDGISDKSSINIDIFTELFGPLRSPIHTPTSHAQTRRYRIHGVREQWTSFPSALDGTPWCVSWLFIPGSYFAYYLIILCFSLVQMVCFRK